MATSGDLALDRRHFIGAIGALAVAVAPPLRAFAHAQSGVRLGDAHAHLFNLADLPARGFFEHSVMWNSGLQFWIVRPMWPAMLDMIEFLKSHTLTARAELQSYPRRPGTGDDVSEDVFEAESTRRISNMARQSRLYRGSNRIARPAPLSASQQFLRDSYYQLAAWFGIFGRPILRREPGGAPDDAYLDDAAVDRIRRGARRILEGSCPESPSAASNSGLRGSIGNLFGWAHMLMQSRQRHLEVYRELIGDGEVQPRMIVNLLVDYDEWLGDAPAAGSESDAQIELWDRIRADHSGSIDIRTFAGFDPLKDGLERLGFRRAGAPAGTTTFARNSAHLQAGRIHGFKLYPPMGFRPIGNDPSMFNANGRGLRVVRARLAECGIGWDRLPGLLNDSLEAFYQYCEAHRVPILAHAYHGNDSWHCAAARAGPSGWLEVVARYRGLKICLAHFAQAQDFVRAADRRSEGRSVDPSNWPFLGMEELLGQNRNGGAEVFIDLSDMIELLHDRRGEDRAAAFFRELRAYCRDYDPDCRHIMFGTDWIVLEREGRSRAYVARLRAGMAAAGWSETWQQNLLHDNLQRFLNDEA